MKNRFRTRKKISHERIISGGMAVVGNIMLANGNTGRLSKNIIAGYINIMASITFRKCRRWKMVAIVRLMGIRIKGM